MAIKVTMGIKRLVEFVLKSGNIDSRFTGTDRALLGSRIHRKLQKSAGKNYYAEQSLTLEIYEGDIDYSLYGRADGIIYEESGITIDEIKTVSTPLEQIDENYSQAHWAQGCFYAYIICKEKNIDNITVQLTYYNIDTDEIKRIPKQFTRAELGDIVLNVLKKYRRWAQMSYTWKGERNYSLNQIKFPFDTYRDGQRSMAVAVYKTARDGGRLFACAPTGIGKTMSTVFPSLKAMGEGYNDKLFYLTAKTITSQAATQAVDILYNKNPDLHLKTIAITAKDKCCMLDKRNCNPVACPYAKGYFDRVNGVLYSAVNAYSNFSFELVKKIASENMLCPYEFSLDLSEWCDIIICDYNYLFDPTVKLQRFFESRKGDYAFLIDEAHNLPDRAREMYSAQLDKRSFLTAKKLIDKKERKLINAVNSVNNYLLEYRRTLEEDSENDMVLKSVPASIEAPLRKFVKECADYFDRNKQTTQPDEIINLYFDVKFFLRIYEEYDDKYVTIITRYADNLIFKLFCTDPSTRVDTQLDTGNSAVAFSATLTPIDYYRSQLGDHGEKMSVKSPFDQANLGLYVCDTLSTKYTDRERTLEDICQLIHTATTTHKGNYIAYFPSYAYMKMAYELYQENYPQQNTVIQTSEMNDEQRKEFISAFDTENNLTAFCVLGGIYGEGIDLVGDKLSGCVIVGVGLPQINTQLNTLRDYYDSQEADGFSYAYQYPGMNKVMQAVGRVIRTESDRGIALLIDTRFTTSRYLANMPPHWNHLRRITSPGVLKDELEKFWDK